VNQLFGEQTFRYDFKNLGAGLYHLKIQSRSGNYVRTSILVVRE